MKWNNHCVIPNMLRPGSNKKAGTMHNIAFSRQEKRSAQWGNVCRSPAENLQGKFRVKNFYIFTEKTLVNNKVKGH